VLDATDARSFAKAIRYAASIFVVPAPEVYARPEQKEAFSFVSCIDKQTLVPALVVGAPLTDKRPERDLAFEVARRMSFFRPERFLRLLMPQPAQLAHLVEVVMALAAEADEKQEPTGEVAKTATAMRTWVAAPQLEQVVAFGRRLRQLGTRSEAAALGWAQGTDLTAARAGLLLAGDLEISARLIASEPASPTALPTTQRLLDLIWSSVTEELFAVRRHLALAST
jgi:hypothetical protein